LPPAKENSQDSGEPQAEATVCKAQGDSKDEVVKTRSRTPRSRKPRQKAEGKRIKKRLKNPVKLMTEEDFEPPHND